jgi:hypothetical protein
MRVLIRCLDRFLRHANGVFEFCDEADCLFRLQFGKAPRDLHLSDGTVVRQGAPVLMLHLWNERMPPMGKVGPDLRWAVIVHRRLVASLRMIAAWVAREPRAAEVQAIGGVTVLASSPEGRRLLERLGFDILPHPQPLGDFGAFWENLYIWGLMWTFNAASLRHRQLLRLRRTEMWVSAQHFLERYGTAYEP